MGKKGAGLIGLLASVCVFSSPFLAYVLTQTEAVTVEIAGAQKAEAAAEEAAAGVPTPAVQGTTLPMWAFELGESGVYWATGTHYFTPLDATFETREDHIAALQRPNSGVYVVGEAVSAHQGWCEGALESVEAVIARPEFKGRAPRFK